MINNVAYTAFIKSAENLLEEKPKDGLGKKLLMGANGLLLDHSLNKSMHLGMEELEEFEPKTPGETRAKVNEISKNMGVKDKTFWKRSKDSGAGWLKKTNLVNSPTSTGEATLAHEVGHLKNWQGVGKARMPIAGATRIAPQISAPLATLNSAMTDNPNYTAANINAVVSAPRLLDEGLASARAIGHMVKSRGLKSGLHSSASLIPAFGTYASTAATPYIITALRKKFPPKNEKTAMGIPSLNTIKPIAGGLARSAMGGAKNLLKQNWNSMGTFDKALTVGLPLATTGATMFNKKDQMGRSRAERLSTMGGNIAGGMMGMQIGNNLTKGLGGGRLGGAAKFLGSTAGAIGGSILGEKATAAPFNMTKKAPSQPAQGYAMNNNMQSPQVPNPGALT